MPKILSISPEKLTTARLHGYLLDAVTPRPIALASTISKEGKPNLSPFSFFNIFSAHPPVLVFSPARRVRDNTIKHTLENVKEVPEVVINLVNYNMVYQMSLSSTEYPQGVNEFIKSGFTMVASDKIKPFRVGESPVQLECKVIKIDALGKEGGAGNLVICEVVKIHICEDILDENKNINQYKIDLVSRMGGNWYSRVNKGLFSIPKPLTSIGIGIDAIPEEIRLSKVLTGNNLGMLGTIEVIPSLQEVEIFLEKHQEFKTADINKKHKIAQKFLNNNDVLSAWKVLLIK